MHDYHHSDRRSLTEKKRKESDIIFDEQKKHRRSSSSYVHQRFSKFQFDDARLFCDDCKKFYENICPYHKQSYIPDQKVG